MFGYRLQKIWKQPSVAQIEKTLSDLADKYGYEDVWLYGNYYEGLYREGNGIQIMMDPAQYVMYRPRYMHSCYRALGLELDIYMRDDADPLTEYILANSRLVHHA